MKIEKLDNQGRGIAYENGKINFISNALPDEEVSVDIVREKDNYSFGKTSKIIIPSKDRVIPSCPYKDECGGCNIMHMNFDLQKSYKKDKVKEILKKYADIEIEPIFIENDKVLNYRDKITLKIENNLWGFFSELSHKFVPIKECLLANQNINKIISNQSIFKISNGTITIRTNYKGEVLISIDTDEEINIDLDNIDESVIGIVVNKKTIYKNNFIVDRIKGINYKISYDSFFQVNRFMNEQIMNILENNLEGNNLLDLYCGVGSLGLSIANKFKKIYGVEKVENAILNAEENALNNNINNATFYVGDTAKVLNEINIDFDALIVDPPRSGLNAETLNGILKINPKVLCYVSCNPITLARDLKLLKEKYSIRLIYALDMFPNTYHVECVCILKVR